MANFSQSASLEGLGTYTFIVPSTDLYLIQGTLTLPSVVPTAAQGAGGGGIGTGSVPGLQINSQVVVTISLNGDEVFTSNPGDRGFCIPALECEAEDEITIERSSGLSQDQQKNAVRLTLAISEGA